tara:strand:+ start:23692 stop:24759 length:1068 start_codon:yes stop_codon:yes gene_type:complete
LRETILKIGNIWDDADVIRKFNKNNTDITDVELTKILYEIDKEDIKKQIINNHITDHSLFEFYEELEKKDKTGKADLKYDTIKMSKIENLFIAYTYFNIDKMFDIYDDYIDNKKSYENKFENIIDNLLNNRVSGKVIRNLILYYHYKLNHFNIQGELNYVYYTIKFINDEIIDLDSLFKSKLEIKYDIKGEGIGCNFTDIKIDGIKILNNENKITELYNEYLLKEGIKTPLYIGKTSSINKDLIRFTKTPKRKLEFLLFDLFGIKIENLPNRRGKRISGKLIFYYDYLIYYDLKDFNNEEAENIYNHIEYFNFDERLQLIQNQKLQFIPESDEDTDTDIDEENQFYINNETTKTI